MECDLPERCTGASEWCPEDLHKHDGTECTNKELAYCYNGQCRSHISHCRYIYGDPAENGPYSCYFFNNYGL